MRGAAACSHIVVEPWQGGRHLEGERALQVQELDQVLLDLGRGRGGERCDGGAPEGFPQDLPQLLVVGPAQSAARTQHLSAVQEAGFYRVLTAATHMMTSAQTYAHLDGQKTPGTSWGGALLVKLREAGFPRVARPRDHAAHLKSWPQVETQCACAPGEANVGEPPFQVRPPPYPQRPLAARQHMHAAPTARRLTSSMTKRGRRWLECSFCSTATSPRLLTSCSALNGHGGRECWGGGAIPHTHVRPVMLTELQPAGAGLITCPALRRLHVTALSQVEAGEVVTMAGVAG